MPSAPTQSKIVDWMFLAGVITLPLVFWPGLEHPFSTPKVWWIAALGALALLRVASAGVVDTRWPWLLWPAVVGLSAAIAPDVSLRALLLAVIPLPLCWAVRQDERLQELALDGLRWGSAALSAVALLQWAGLDLVRLSGWMGEAVGDSRMRVYGTLGNPDFVAAWLCGTLGLWHRRSSSPVVFGNGRHLPSWVFPVVQLLAILATGSRVFLLAMPVALAVGMWQRRQGWKWMIGLVSVAAAILLFSAGRPLGLTSRGRLYLDRIVAQRLAHTPPAGFGPGAFVLEFPKWQMADPEIAQFGGHYDHAHNDFLEFWVEYGPIGFLALAGVGVWLSRKARNSGVLVSIAALLAVALVDFPLHRPPEWGLYWLMFGILGNGRTKT